TEPGATVQPRCRSGGGQGRAACTLAQSWQRLPTLKGPMSKAHDSERPGPPKRRVLRKIDPKRAAMAPPAQGLSAPPAPRPSAHNSAPPVVSTVATPLATYQDSLPDAPSGSSWRGVVMGTVLGLA